MTYQRRMTRQARDLEKMKLQFQKAEQICLERAESIESKKKGDRIRIQIEKYRK